MRDDDGDMFDYSLQIQRLSADGQTLDQTDLEETPVPGENLYYDDAGAHELPIDGPFRLARNGHVVGLPDDEGLFLLAEWTYSVKLYRLNADYGRVWGVQVMPANIGMVFHFSPSLLVRDDEGRIHVASEIFEDDAHIFGEHFHRPPLAPIGSYDVVVQRFTPGGAFSAARILGGVAVDHPTAMTVRDGSVLILGAARITKHLPNRTMEWDLLAMRGSIDDASPVVYRTFDLSRDDFGYKCSGTGSQRRRRHDRPDEAVAGTDRREHARAVEDPDGGEICASCSKAPVRTAGESPPSGPR